MLSTTRVARTRPAARRARRLPADESPLPGPHEGMVQLQRSIGNRAVSQLVQRGVPVGVGGAPSMTDSLTKQKWIDATEKERIDEIDRLLDAGPWWNESNILAMWKTFGSKLPEVASRHSSLWQRCADNGVNVNDLPAMAQLREQFGADVVATTKKHLQTNRLLVRKERARLGLPTGEEGAEPGEQSDVAAIAEEAAVAELQELAEAAQQIEDGEEALLAVPVGTEMAGYGDSTESVETDLYFDPQGRPPADSGTVVDEERWQKAQDAWDAFQAARLAVARQSPGLFAVMEHGERGDLRKVATAEPEAAKAMVAGGLDRVTSNIDKAEVAINSGDLNWRDLTQVHRQLMTGEVKASSVNWAATVPNGVAKEVMADHEARQWWTDLALGTASAAAFVFSEIATAGWATVAWAGAGLALSATQVGISMERAWDVAEAAGASAGPDSRLATHEQADAAWRQALLDTAFFALDALGATKVVRRGIQGVELAGRGARLAKPASVKDISSLSGQDAVRAIEDSVRERGAAQTIARSGRSAEDLAEIVGRDTDIGKRLLSRVEHFDEGLDQFGLGQITGWAKSKLGQLSEAVSTVKALKEIKHLPPDAAASTIESALDVLGPAATLKQAGGWELLAAKLPESSDAARRLNEWRNRIESDMLAEFGPDQVMRTGSKGSMKNDFDVSTLGPDATANRELVRQWLAARLGVWQDELKLVLHAEVFVDPRRMHLASMAELGLDPADAAELIKKQSRREEELVWNRRLTDAIGSGDEAMVAALRTQMDDLGLAVIPDFRTLSAGERRIVSQQVDTLHADLLEAAQAGDRGRVAELVDEISVKQALVNASDRGAYFTGGGPRTHVSEREGLPGYRPGDAPLPKLPAEQFTNLLDQVAKLDDVAADLKKVIARSDAADTAEVLSKGMRALQKYSHRLDDASSALHPTDDPISALINDLLLEDIDKLATATRSRGALTAAEATEIAQKARKVLRALQDRSAETTRLFRAQAGLADVSSDLGAVHTMLRADLAAQRAARIVDLAVTEAEEVVKILLKEWVGEVPPMASVSGPAGDGSD